MRNLVLAVVSLLFLVVPWQALAQPSCFESLESLREVYPARHAYHRKMTSSTTPEQKQQTLLDWWTNLFEIPPSTPQPPSHKSSTQTNLCWHVLSKVRMKTLSVTKKGVSKKISRTDSERTRGMKTEIGKDVPRANSQMKSSQRTKDGSTTITPLPKLHPQDHISSGTRKSYQVTPEQGNRMRDLLLPELTPGLIK